MAKSEFDKWMPAMEHVLVSEEVGVNLRKDRMVDFQPVEMVCIRESVRDSKIRAFLLDLAGFKLMANPRFPKSKVTKITGNIRFVRGESKSNPDIQIILFGKYDEDDKHSYFKARDMLIEKANEFFEEVGLKSILLDIFNKTSQDW